LVRYPYSLSKCMYSKRGERVILRVRWREYHLRAARKLGHYKLDPQRNFHNTKPCTCVSGIDHFSSFQFFICIRAPTDTFRMSGISTPPSDHLIKFWSWNWLLKKILLHFGDSEFERVGKLKIAAGNTLGWLKINSSAKVYNVRKSILHGVRNFHWTPSTGFRTGWGPLIVAWYLLFKARQKCMSASPVLFDTELFPPNLQIIIL
jgi:hypothetical protein